MPKIKIANPRPGSARYTTVSQAERYVRRGEAVLIGDTLQFLSGEERRHMAGIEVQLQRSERRASDVYIRGMVWWNGDAGTDLMKRPGEVRS